MPKRSPRLNPTQLNNLNLSHLVGAGYTLQDGKIESNKLEVSYQKVLKENETPIIVFQAISDTKKPRQNLAYINDVIQKFENNLDQKTTLLIPLMQSRLWKQHCVLVEVTIGEGRKKINTHDSQSWWKNLFYPNCLKDLKKQGYQVEYTSYGKQKDNYSCAYFVYNYIKEILKTSSEGLKNIFVSLNSLEGDEDPIGKLIQENFQQKYPNIREIKSGEKISWKKELFVQEISENYSKELDLVTVEDEDFFSEEVSSDKKQINGLDRKNEATTHCGNNFFPESSGTKLPDFIPEQKMTI